MSITGNCRQGSDGQHAHHNASFYRQALFYSRKPGYDLEPQLNVLVFKVNACEPSTHLLEQGARVGGQAGVAGARQDHPRSRGVDVLAGAGLAGVRVGRLGSQEAPADIGGEHAGG